MKRIRKTMIIILSVLCIVPIRIGEYTISVPGAGAMWNLDGKGLFDADFQLKGPQSNPLAGIVNRKKIFCERSRGELMEDTAKDAGAVVPGLVKAVLYVNEGHGEVRFGGSRHDAMVNYRVLIRSLPKPALQELR